MRCLVLLFALGLVLVLAACETDGHHLGGYADGAYRVSRPVVIYPVYPVVPVYPAQDRRLRYYGQPRRDRWQARDDPYLSTNDPWLAD